MQNPQGEGSPGAQGTQGSLAQFLQQAGITSEADVANRLVAMQQQLDTQAQQQQQAQSQLQEAMSMLNSLTGQLNEAMSRAQSAEQERRDALRIAAASLGHESGSFQSSIVDSKGVGQPFKYSGGSDQDFSEWSHKVTTYLKAKFGADIEKALKWSVQQRKSIVERLPGGARTSADGRQIAFDPVFGEEADDLDRIANLSQTVVGIYTYLIAFTTGDSNKIVRNAGSDAGLEAWRRLHNEYDPTSAMRRVTILGLVQNPPKCEKVESLGAALEDWLAKKRQYEEFTDQQGRACRISDDSLMAAMYKLMPSSLEQQVMFHSDDYDSFEDLYDRLVSYASTKHSLKMTDRPVGAPKKSESSAPMDVDALTRKGKGKSFTGKCNRCGKPGHKAVDCRSLPAGSGKGDRMSNVQCWVCNGYGHYGKDCKKGGKPTSDSNGKGNWKGGKSKAKGKGFGGKKGGKDKGKKGGMSSVDWEWQDDAWYEDGWQSGWGEQPADEPPAASDTSKAGVGSLDLNPLELPALCQEVNCNSIEAYKVTWKGADWLRINYDSGAATTAIPDELVDGPLQAQGEFVVASGEEIPNFGKFRVPASDANGKRRSFTAYATKVHKPLGSAAEFSKSHDCLLWAEGGSLIPKQSALALGLRKEYYRLKTLFGGCDELPLYREGNLYNLYLKPDGVPEQLNPMSVGGSSSSAGPASGNSRQVSQP